MGRTLRTLLVVAITAATAACGGGGSSGASASLQSGDVAVVGTTHITKTQLDHAIELTVKSMTLQKQTPPKAGTSAYTTQVVQPTLHHLVLGAQVRNIAAELGVTASSSDVDKAVSDAITKYYGGVRSKYQADLKKYGLTETDVRYEFGTSVLESKVQTKLLAQVKVTDAAVQSYYAAHKSSYTTTADTRVVDYVLEPDKASATAALTKLAGGASFASVAAGAIDTSASHEPFTATKGQLDKAFEQSAFTLPTNQLSPLVQVDKTYAGQSLKGKCKPTCYFIIRPTADVVKAGTSQPFSKVQAQIRSQLLQTRQQAHLTSVIKGLEAKQAKLTKYASGYSPTSTTSSLG
jgi:parvulin-like peptidyl-prolyl isomerase